MKERNIVTSIILTFLTCGIYTIIWYTKATDDAAYLSGDTSISGGTVFLYTLLTCGIYYFFWNYKMGKMLATAQQKNGLVANDNSFLYLLLTFFGLGLVSLAIMQSELNNIITNKNAA